ncbi:hypothetical protein Tco_0338384 [Tanacetum coccineum]
MSKDSSAPGTDNRPPMLEENDYESWKIRIERYIKEKGAVLDAEAKAFLADVECTVPLAEPLALSTTNMFQV